MNAISIISSKELQTLNSKNDYIFINFDYKYAIKISFFYEKIKKSERNRLIKLFYQLTSIEIRVDDTLGKLHIILLKLLIDGEKNKIIISDIGFIKNSFTFLVDNFRKIFENLNNLKDKSVIIVECNLDIPENIKYLENYFREY